MSTTYIPVALRRQVVEDYAGRCAYCYSPEYLLDGIYEIDHIIPEVAGGETTRQNLCLACRLCNDHKAMKQTAVDPLTNRRTRLYHPRRQQWSRHFAWALNGQTIVGRTQCGRATILALQLNNASLTRMRGFWNELGAYAPDWERNKR